MCHLATLEAHVCASNDDANGLKARPANNLSAIFSGVCGGSLSAKNEILYITLAHFITHLHARERSDASARMSVRALTYTHSWRHDGYVKQRGLGRGGSAIGGNGSHF